MGKQAKERRFTENEAWALGRKIRTSPQKLNLVAQTIRGLDVESAIAELTFFQASRCRAREEGFAIGNRQCRKNRL